MEDVDEQAEIKMKDSDKSTKTEIKETKIENYSTIKKKENHRKKEDTKKETMCSPNVNKLIDVKASHLTSNSTGGCGELPYNNNLRFPDRPDLVESSSNNELVACATLYCEKHKTANGLS